MTTDCRVRVYTPGGGSVTRGLIVARDSPEKMNKQLRCRAYCMLHNPSSLSLIPSLFLDSENTVVTLSALLASLNSCCNPWIYMVFSGHLLSDFVHCLPCCRRLRNKFGHQDSDSSFRRTTLLSRLQAPRLSEPFRDLNPASRNNQSPTVAS